MLETLFALTMVLGFAMAFLVGMLCGASPRGQALVAKLERRRP